MGARTAHTARPRARLYRTSVVMTTCPGGLITTIRAVSPIARSNPTTMSSGPAWMIFPGSECSAGGGAWPRRRSVKIPRRKPRMAAGRLANTSRAHSSGVRDAEVRTAKASW
jgi:hypothetical protein